HVLRGLPDIVDVALERELRRVDADDDQPLLCVLLRPRPDERERPEPVDAGVRPEVDEHDLPAQALRGQGRRVEPTRRPVESWKVPPRGQQRHAWVATTADQAHAAPPPSTLTRPRPPLRGCRPSPPAAARP